MNEQDWDSKFDWPPLGEAFWKEVQATTGATLLQTKFACCRHRGMTATGSAKAAGYTGDSNSIRQAGSRAAKTNAVMELLALAAAEAGGGNDGVVSTAEAKRILSRLARGSDPNVRIKALESLGKLDRDDWSSRIDQKDLLLPDAMLLTVVFGCRDSKYRADFFPIFWMEVILPAQAWWAPLLKQIVPYLAKHHPIAWAECRKRLLGLGRDGELEVIESATALSDEEILSIVLDNFEDIWAAVAEGTGVETRTKAFDDLVDRKLVTPIQSGPNSAARAI